MTVPEQHPLLRQGWSRQKVEEEQRRREAHLDGRGVQFAPFPSAEASSARAAAFTAAHIDGASTTGNPEGLVALDHAGRIIGAVTLSEDRPNARTYIGHVRYLAVAPEWRRQGVGTMLLCIMDQRLPATIAVRTFVGGCAPSESRFYQHAGFTVLQPGAVLPGFIIGEPRGRRSSNPEYPCWFYRTWGPEYA